MAKQSGDRVTKEIPLDFKWPEMDKALEIMESIKEVMKEHHNRRTYLLLEMSGLESQGIEFFGTTYRDRKYLYKLLPSKAGETRKRIYVGADPVAIKLELEKLDRYNKHAELKRELDHLEKRMTTRVWNLRYI